MKRPRIEAVVLRIQIDILDIEQQPGAGLAADQVEEFRIGHLGVRPFEHVGDVLQEERHRDAGLDGTHLGDDLLRRLLGLRQRQEVGEIAARDPGEGEVLAVGGAP